VAIFQGLSQSVGGVALSQPYAVSSVAVSALPTFDQERLATAIPAGGLDEAHRIVDRLASQSALCVQVPSTDGCPTPSTSPAPSFTTAPSVGSGLPSAAPSP
jgi:protein phosphatase